MNLNFYQILWIISYVLIFVFTFYERERWSTSFAAKRPLLVGILLLFGSTVFNSVVEGRWDLKYLIDFLRLIKVGRSFFLMTCGLSYALILYGTEILLIVFVKNLKR